MRGNECSSTRFRARQAAVGGVALFWLGTLVAGALVPGYSARADYISSLAGCGSEVAALGITALAALGLAHLAAAYALRGAVGLPLALAGVAQLTVAAFRIGCPFGAAGCGFGRNDASADLVDTVHVLAVDVYEVVLVVAMVAVVIGAVRRKDTGWAVGTAVAAGASVLLAWQVGGPDSGWWQRGWLVVNTGWLVVAVLRGRPCRTPALASDP